MRMKYDVYMLAEELDFDPNVVEKVCWISDILAEIYRDPFLEKRLSLTGGTALNLVHAENIPRLSVDLDFNYRHMDSRDWGKVRDKVDERLKNTLESMGYEELTINPSYPLGRINAAFINESGRREELRLEVGYLRRFPILEEDAEAELDHIGKNKSIEVLTSRREELFADKIITGVKRKNSRDVFDIATISDLEFDYKLLRKCTILESFSVGVNLHEIDFECAFETVDMDTSLSNLLRRGMLDEINFENVRTRASELLKDVKDSLTNDELSAVENFYEEGEFCPELISTYGDFHPRLDEHPAIQWTLENS